MKDKPLAHSENSLGKIHTLSDHLQGVATYAQTFSLDKIQENNIKFACLFHDFGKYLPTFQQYLKEGGRRGSVPHARWGAVVARRLKNEEVSFAIDGHHAGLPDYITWQLEHTTLASEELQQFITLYENFKKDLALTDHDIKQFCMPSQCASHEKDIHTRFLFSCLTDADWLDTEEHFSPHISIKRNTYILQDIINNTIEKLDTELQKLASIPSPINELRTQSRLDALQKAHYPQGFFSLNLPTGLGKTFTSFRWALEHAKKYNLQRIIIVLPYTNIIDQTAQKLKSIVGDEYILEHHASYIYNESANEGASLTQNEKKLATENWDYPIIITTSIQFFETLFSNRPSKCRKFHNISKAVVILDEVQTLPKDLVEPTLRMLEDVQQHLETTFVFCTATMPAFKKRENFLGLEHIEELALNAEELFMTTQRVCYTFLNELHPVSLSYLTEILQDQQESTLVICNVKRLAHELYTALEHSNRWDAVYHLSTNMCPVHRKEVLKKIIHDRKMSDTSSQKKIMVITTQLVEAGVDLDFPCVFRQMAPLESIIQAAGRCNREGRMEQFGVVTLFELEEKSTPDPFYKTQSDFVRTLLSANNDYLNNHTAFAEYYIKIIDSYIKAKPQITQERKQRNFATVAGMYKLIDSETQSLFIWSYNDSSQELYTTLREKEKYSLHLTREEFRLLQQYSVQIYDNVKYKYVKSIEQSPLGLLIWNGAYDDAVGIQFEAHDDVLIL